MQSAAEQEYVEYVTARLPAFRRLAFLLCGSEHQADDLVQQMITNLYVRWSKVSKVDHLDPYVRSMLVRTFLDERRRAWYRVALFAAPPERQALDPPNVEDRHVLRSA